MSEHEDVRSVFLHSDKRAVSGAAQQQHISCELCKCQCLTSVDEDLTIVRVWTPGDKGRWDALWLDSYVVCVCVYACVCVCLK